MPTCDTAYFRYGKKVNEMIATVVVFKFKLVIYIPHDFNKTEGKAWQRWASYAKNTEVGITSQKSDDAVTQQSEINRE